MLAQALMRRWHLCLFAIANCPRFCSPMCASFQSIKAVCTAQKNKKGGHRYSMIEWPLPQTARTALLTPLFKWMLGEWWSNACLLSFFRVGQNHIFLVCIRYFWQGNRWIYGHIRCIYTVLANPILFVSAPAQSAEELLFLRLAPTPLPLRQVGVFEGSCKEGCKLNRRLSCQYLLLFTAAQL